MSLRYFTAGESHGKGLTAILEGLPANIPLTREAINTQLKRRQGGYGRGGRMKIESDEVTLTAGVRHGKTLGSPIALWIENKDFRAWTDEMASEALADFISKKTVTRPRPGHADLNGGIKYDQRDLRNILERASARETAARVAVGAICRQFLAAFGIRVTAHVVSIGDISIGATRPDFDAIASLQENDPCRCVDATISAQMRAKIDAAQKAGDSLGGVFEVIFTGLPPGLGSHVQWDRKLDAQLACAMLSIQAVKGVEFGLGFACARLPGSQVHDQIRYDGTNKKFFHISDNAGGIVGGMTNGEDIIVRGALKPISTLYTPLESVDIATKESIQASIERSDTCAVPAAAVIAENVLAITIANALLEKCGGDSLGETRRNYEAYLKQVAAY